jgi:hypothetical protein
MFRFSGIKSFERTSFVAAVLSLVATVAWCSIAVSDRPRKGKIADELASTIEFFRGPKPNHTGTKLFYAQTAKEGIAGYLLDIANGHRKLLFEHEQAHLDGVGLLGWTPDDKVLAYSVRSPAGDVIFCDGSDGKELGRVAEAKVIMNSTWLSDKALVYVNNNQDMTLVRKVGEEWQKSNLFDRKLAAEQEKLAGGGPAKGKEAPARGEAKSAVECLTAVSENYVAWKKGGSIWGYRLGTPVPMVIWESATNKLVDFYFNHSKNALTLHCNDSGQDYLLDFSPNFTGHGGSTSLSDKLTLADNKVDAIASIQGGSGCAYLTQDSKLVVRPDLSSTNQIELSWATGVGSLVTIDDHVYLIGSLTNGPMGLWDYAINQKNLNCVVSATDKPFTHTKVTTTSREVTTDELGREVSYYVSVPANYKKGGKYPMVIGFTGYHWRAQEASVPNAGCFYAACNALPKENQVEYVSAIYAAATQDSRIDKNRVYLMGISATANDVGFLLQARPDLWYGAILLSPVSVPNVHRLGVAKILIDSGGNDAYLKKAGGVEMLRNFQDAAAVVGIPVTLSVHENASHVYRSTFAERERMKNIIEFLSAK